MADRSDSPAPSKPRPVPGAGSPGVSGSRSPVAASASRNTSIARLASPVPSGVTTGTPPIRQVPTLSQLTTGTQTPLAGVEASNSVPGPGRSALAAALQGAYGRSPPRYGTPPLRPLSPAAAGAALQGDIQQSTYGSFDKSVVQDGRTQLGPNEDPEIVKRHLVQPSNADDSDGHSRSQHGSSTVRGRASVAGLTQDTVGDPDRNGGEEFSSLQLQGGDITRQVYRWAEDADAQSQTGGRGKRSKSFNVFRPEPVSDTLDISTIKAPGGFRRNYLQRSAPSPSPTRRMYGAPSRNQEHVNQNRRRPKLFTANFIEFLTLYGHFAGEELEEDDEVLEPGDYFASDGGGAEDFYDDDDMEDRDDDEPGEGSNLLTPRTPGGRKRRRKPRTTSGQSTPIGAALLLLKSFVGTGVLFLPKAYLNGGMVFSNVVLLGVASLSYYCFILLVNTKLKIDGSFGDIGGIVYGKFMRTLILTSIVLSQIGFVAAYIVFTSENLQAFILAVSRCRTFIDIKFMVLMQLIIFLPLSLVRDISKLGGTALVADLFIMLGLIYLYYYDISTLIIHGQSDVKSFNPRDWTLFIGTAIFTFEGIGLIIPIQETMKKPKKFPRVLAIVMVIITLIFMSMGAFSYAAFGSSTRTVVLLNLPQDNKFVNAVQFLYSLAILLSTPLQLFPAIRIMENELFTRSGKYNAWIKWQKNIFRFFFVIGCALLAWGGAGDLDKFVALVGSFACVPLVYVYPPLLHLKAVAQSRKQRFADIALCIFGCVGMVYTTTLTVMSWAGAAGPKAPGYCDEKLPLPNGLI
ncbi:neutral amino acid transporter [Xylographa soralifera]|nr:neutral amino acid transporter [Xylographa soralifera]